MYFHHKLIIGRSLIFLAIVSMVHSSYGQGQKINFQDLSAFKDPGKSWKVAGDVYAELDEAHELEVKKGTGILVYDSFTGHPAGLRWSDKPASPVKITAEHIYSKVDQRKVKDENGRYIKPENVKNRDFVSLHELQDDFPQIKTPAVWLPHGILGISNSEIVKIPEGSFGVLK